VQMVDMGCIEEREAEEVLFFFYERNEPHSLYDILSQNLHRRFALYYYKHTA